MRTRRPKRSPSRDFARRWSAHVRAELKGASLLCGLDIENYRMSRDVRDQQNWNRAERSSRDKIPPSRDGMCDDDQTLTKCVASLSSLIRTPVIPLVVISDNGLPPIKKHLSRHRWMRFVVAKICKAYLRGTFNNIWSLIHNYVRVWCLQCKPASATWDSDVFSTWSPS